MKLIKMETYVTPRDLHCVLALRSDQCDLHARGADPPPHYGRSSTVAGAFLLSSSAQSSLYIHCSLQLTMFNLSVMAKTCKESRYTVDPKGLL